MIDRTAYINLIHDVIARLERYATNNPDDRVAADKWIEHLKCRDLDVTLRPPAAGGYDKQYKELVGEARAFFRDRGRPRRGHRNH